jgi:hypothetical protein
VLYRISQTDNASYAGTKANYNVLPWEANCSTIFSASLLTVSLMNSSLPTKPFRSHKPNILQWLLFHDAL